MSEQTPYLSAVVTSRNDDHGGNLLPRMQVFTSAFIEQCKRHGLAAELIVVEWNPPPKRPSLADALRWPQDPGPCRVRLIRVPPEIHRRLRHGLRLEGSRPQRVFLPSPRPDAREPKGAAHLSLVPRLPLGTHCLGGSASRNRSDSGLQSPQAEPAA